jgi:hypothetical protein
MMSVEPIGFEMAVLEGTDLAISSTFNTEVHRKDGLRIKATVHVVGGRLICRALELSTRGWRHRPKGAPRVGPGDHDSASRESCRGAGRHTDGGRTMVGGIAFRRWCDRVRGAPAADIDTRARPAATDRRIPRAGRHHLPPSDQGPFEDDLDGRCGASDVLVRREDVGRRSHRTALDSAGSQARFPAAHRQGPKGRLTV